MSESAAISSDRLRAECQVGARRPLVGADAHGDDKSRLRGRPAPACPPARARSARGIGDSAELGSTPQNRTTSPRFLISPSVAVARPRRWAARSPRCRGRPRLRCPPLRASRSASDHGGALRLRGEVRARGRRARARGPAPGDGGGRGHGVLERRRLAGPEHVLTGPTRRRTRPSPPGRRGLARRSGRPDRHGEVVTAAAAAEAGHCSTRRRRVMRRLASRTRQRDRLVRRA